MNDENPFEVTSEIYGDRSGRVREPGEGGVSTRTLELLNKTRPWVRLMGVVMWIATVLMIIGSVAAIVGAFFSRDPFMFVFGPVYLVFGIVYGYLARSLTSYASRIDALQRSEQVKDLEDALESQMSFWRLAGIMTLVFIVLYAAVIVGAIAIGGFGPRGF